MEPKKEYINRFTHALFNTITGMKRTMADCSSLSGNLSEKEFMLINYLGQKHHLKMSEIAGCMTAPSSTITSIVDKLVDKKYLERYHSAEDRRVVLVTLASKGKELYDTFMDRQESMAKIILGNLSTEDQENMVKYLEKIPAILNKSVENVL